jgi:polar amino acid transport system substrate-binding protein
MGNYLLWVLCGVICILLGVFVILVVNIRRRSKAERATISVGQKLKDSYKELELAYQEVTATKNELSVKYEQLKKSQDKVKQIAYSDYLTGLPNRVALVEMLDSVMATLRHDEVIAILDIDIDNFKDINDTLGHSYGDELLLDVTHRLEGIFGKTDFLARIGGDEYAVLVQNIASASELELKIDMIRNTFIQPFTIATKEFFVTVSVGISLAPKDGKTTQSLLKNMNSAMYVAKEQGRNTYCYFDNSINQKMLDKLELQSELRKAIEEDQFLVYYQAQMDLAKGKVVGFEALARWKHPTKGIVAPIYFIPLAEENGMIVEIGMRILKEACLQLKQWELLGYKDLNMAVNFSARQFKDKNFLDMVYDVIATTEVNPKQLEFEITESVALDDFEFTIDMINRLKLIGISFSLDDFGTGYSSLSYLKRLPVNNLKIDKSFLDTVLEDNSDQKIIHTMINLARNLNIDVIAEGVEFSEQEIFLKESLCDKAQGYYYSRPVPKEQAFEVLKTYS